MSGQLKWRWTGASGNGPDVGVQAGGTGSLPLNPKTLWQASVGCSENYGWPRDTTSSAGFATKSWEHRQATPMVR